jgi:hypothetical protein
LSFHQGDEALEVKPCRAGEQQISSIDQLTLFVSCQHHYISPVSPDISPPPFVSTPVPSRAMRLWRSSLAALAAADQQQPAAAAKCNAKAVGEQQQQA